MQLDVQYQFTIHSIVLLQKHWSHVQCDTIIQRLLADHVRRVEQDRTGGNIGDEGKEPENLRTVRL